MAETTDKTMENEAETLDNVKRIFDVYEPLICKKCNKSFVKKACFKSHLKTHEFDDHVYELNKKIISEKYRPYKCNVCEKGFTAKRNLLKHLRVIHNNLNEAEKLQVKKTKCPETNCLFACRKMRDLRNHIEKYHEIRVLKDTLHFLNEESFLKWKKEEEDNSVSSFVSFRRTGILKNGMAKKVLLCHRTGQYNPKGKGKYRLKSHGSCKIGGTCPAAMEILQTTDGQITVSYYKTHLGHSHDVKHLQLTREDRAKLSAQFLYVFAPHVFPIFQTVIPNCPVKRIEQGFSLDAILEDVKESIDPETGKTKRIHLLSKKDLHNIMQSCNNKKSRSNLKTEVDDLLLSVAEDAEIDPNQYQNITDLPLPKEQDLQVVATESFVQSNLTITNPMESIQTVSTIPELLQNEVPNATVDALNKATSQLLIVSPNISYKSLAEVILFQPTEAVTQNIPEPQILPQTVENQVTPKSENKCGSKKLSRKQKSIAKNAKSPQLTLALQEKIKKLCDFLPHSEFLTPKQYEIVNRKLDSIISVYDSVNIKNKSKKLAPKPIDDDNANIEPVQETQKVGIECIFSSPQNIVQQQVYETPLYAYVCNYN